MEKLNTKLALVFCLFGLLLPIVSAQVDFDEGISPEDQATFDQILHPVMKIYNFVKYLATAIAGLVLLIAGISYIMSGADPKKRENSKNMAMYVVVGLVIIWAAPLAVQFIVS